MFTDETEQRDGRGHRGARRDERLFPEDVHRGGDNDDDDGDDHNADVDDDCHVNGAAVRGQRIRCRDIGVDGLAVAMSTATARRSVPSDEQLDHRHVLRIFVGFVVRGDQQVVGERPPFFARVAEKTRPCLVQ